MVHGRPRKEICDNCNSYGLIPRFSESKGCPNCGDTPRQITDEELRKILGLKRHQFIPINFTWRKIKEPLYNTELIENKTKI